MTDTFNYSLVQSEAGTYVVRSSVKSFNLDHVTDKDIVSFYSHFSSYASFDTGLLPLDGTGVLAIRSAGNQTQIVTQHQPGLYYVNWGSHEGDRMAKTYYVAQPYRIVIGDFENGNLLGARMFYSPHPISNPSQQLYHVNLPNINCRGYRGNGVGWICLYHKDDWSSFPFNEKVSRFIERCSGVETYNDANMSETDGPRFYASHQKPDYLYDPNSWQQKSSAEGHMWTLDESLWIPVLVKDMDNQEKHYPDGQPLTLAMAMLGNYQAYYTDKNIPKIYNIISREDLTLSNSSISNFVKSSFAAAPVNYVHTKKDNPYAFTVDQRKANGSSVLIVSSNNNEDEEDLSVCHDCDESFSDEDLIPTAYQYQVCSDCIGNYTYLEHLDLWFHPSDDNIVWSEISQEYFHTNLDSTHYCQSCNEFIGVSGNNAQSKKELAAQLYYDITISDKVCLDCFDETINTVNPDTDQPLATSQCYSCQKKVVIDTGWSVVYPTFKTLIPSEKWLSDGDESVNKSYVTLCNDCAPNHYQCPCGLIKPSSESMVPCTPTQISLDNKSFIVNACCSSCVGNATEENGAVVMKYQSFNSDISNIAHNDPVILNTSSGISDLHYTYEEEF